MSIRKKDVKEPGQRLSRTQKKKRDRELQKLGEHLVTLPPDQLASLPLPQDLLEAVKTAKSTHQHGAKRRQMQYIGVLMRNYDPAPIRCAVESLSRSSHGSVLHFKQVEKWRDELISGDDRLMQDILNAYGNLDRKKLSALVKQARKEKEGLVSTKSSKQLFRYLNAAMQDSQ